MVATAQARPPYVTFGVKAVEDRAASLDAGHYVSKDVDYVFITPQGSKDRIERVASEWLAHIDEQSRQERFDPTWVKAFRESFASWKAGQETPLTGSPTRNWGVLSPAQRDMLLALKLFTVEDIAAANEETVSRMGMGGRSLKNRAQEFLNTSGGVSKVAENHAALQVAFEDLKTRNTELEARVELLASQNAAFLATQPRKL